MSSIVSWFWDFGDGTTSTQQHPYHEYLTPGHYTVTLTTTDSYGRKQTYTAEKYVNINSKAGMLFDFGSSESRLCLAYGMQSAGGSSGWSLYSGDNWMWPESRGAIVDVQLEDDQHKIMFDFATGLPFIVNTSERNRPGDDTGTVYRDKVGHPATPEGFPIESTVITPEMVGEDRKYRIKHEETFIDMRPVDKDSPYPYPIEITSELIIDGNSTAREIVRGIDDSREIMFINKDMGDRVQCAIKTTESGFKLTGVETTCLTSDTARYATAEFSNDIDFQTYMATVTKWHSRPENFYDRATGEFDTPVGAPDPATGADGFLYSGFTLNQDAVFSTTVDKAVVYWYPEGSEPTVLADSSPITPTGITRDGWVMVYLDISAYTDLSFGSGSHLYDLRFLPELVADETYLDLYMNDVFINAGEKFLPGYVE